MTRGEFRPEFSLLVRCCRWNFARTESPSATDLPTSLDWTEVVTLARRHRVQGLVWNALAQLGDQLPSHAKQALSSDARSIAATNLAIATECRDLCRDDGMGVSQSDRDIRVEDKRQRL